MTATVKRVAKGKYQFVWAENGQVVYATKDGKKMKLSDFDGGLITGTQEYAEHLLNKFSRFVTNEGGQLI